jgi:hypothetical protein
MNDKMDLSLSGGNGPADSQHRQAAPEPTPICGMMACGFGILGIFGPALFFTPLGFLFSLIAFFRGQAAWGLAGILLAVGGFLTSPLLMGIVGFGAFFMIFDWQEFMRPVYEFLGYTTEV